jgi:fimbrial chaperone protein
MARRLKAAFLVFIFGCLGSLPGAAAASLSVSPTLIDQVAPAKAATVTLQTQGNNPVSVQVRLFRWSQVDGKDQLAPTRDAVASPPMLKVVPGTDYTVRIVWTAKRPVAGEESYRLLVDQLPDPKDKKANQVNLVIRHSIPVFFRKGDERPPAIGWSVVRTKQGLVLTGHNDGDRILSANVDATGQVRVTCTQSSGYSVGLGVGSFTPTTRRMLKGGEFVTYGLYQDSARNQGWGDTVGAMPTGTGTGLTDTYTVYGRVMPQATPSAGTYSDTVAVVITY